VPGHVMKRRCYDLPLIKSRLQNKQTYREKWRYMVDLGQFSAVKECSGQDNDIESLTVQAPNVIYLDLFV
jgi:hypothetical protein